MHVFQEAHVQAAAHAVPGLIDTLGFLYLTLHLAVTGSYLLWLHRRRPAAFPLVRTALLIASGLAVIGYVAFPAAPPRLAGLGIADTISGGHVDLNHGLVSSLYNPFAAVPSMHIGYAVVVGASLARVGDRPLLRLLGVAYPALQLLVIVATGNHFFFDAAAGATIAAVSLWAAAAVSNPGRAPRDGPHACGRRASSVSRTSESLTAVRAVQPAAGSLERMRAIERSPR